MILFKCKFQVDRHSSKKNEKVARRTRTGMFIGKSEKAQRAEAQMIRELFKHKPKKTITEDVSVKFNFIFAKKLFFTKEGKRSKKLPDLSNLYELPQDCLQKVGIIENDSQICSHDGSRRTCGDEYSFIEIEISSFDHA